MTLFYLGSPGCSFGLSSAFLFVLEMLSHLPHSVSNIIANGQRQEFQNIQGRVD